MKLKFLFNCFLSLCIYASINAQPNEAYIQSLTGNVNLDWLKTATQNSSNHNLQWKLKTVPGFQNTSKEARKESVLSDDWSFYANKLDGSISDERKVSLPHSFEKERDYVSGWYISKNQIEKKGDKRYILKLNRVELFSMLYVNGKRCGHHFGGYTPFELDITAALVNGTNMLAIFVYDQSAALDENKVYNQVGITRLGGYNQNDPSKKLPGGLYDNPVLEIREQTAIQDVFVKTSTRKQELEIEYDLTSLNNLSSNSKIAFEILKWPEGDKVDLKIPDIKLDKSNHGIQTCKVTWSNPKLWSPDHPNLYVLRVTLKNGKSKEVVDTRFGFREFWGVGKIFMLNGTPIRLRGESHYHNARYGVDFHREVFKMHKEVFGSNACRIHAFMPPADIMYGADEAGMLLIDQSAIWSVNGSFYVNGGEWFAKNTESEFEEWVKRDRNNPSVVIWDVENEMLRFDHDTHIPWISKLPGYINKFDNTRLINYSGAGWFSPNQDMVSLHMQEHYTRIMDDWKSKGTNPLIMGEFWVGGRSEQRLPNSPELTSVHQRFVEEAKMYEEKLLEMRYFGVAGMMPFRISLLSFFQTPHTAKGYHFTPPNTLEVKKQPQDVLQKIRHVLQPESVFFWPRETYAASNGLIKKELVVCNDGEKESDFEVNWKWDNQTGKSKTITLKPSEQKRIVIEDESPSETSQLIATLYKNNILISADTLFITSFKPSELKITKTIQIYKDAVLAEKLTKAGFKAESKDAIPSAEAAIIWVIPEHASNRDLNTVKAEILNFLKAGGAMLCLKQDQAPMWFPLKFQFGSANQSLLQNYAAMGWKGTNKDLFFSTLAPIYANAHPVFEGLNTANLQRWDTFDGRVCDDVFARPSSNNKYEQGNWRTLSGGTRREHVSLGELFYGKGILLACQLNIIENLENIQAKSLFINMLNYLSSKKPIALNSKIAIRGQMNVADIAELTGVLPVNFEGAKAENQDLMIAFEGASLTEIKEWASKGGKVLILSSKLSQAYEGVSYNSEEGKHYLATKQEDHSLFYGMSSANFMNDKLTMVKGYFSNIPKEAKVLLQGFSSESTFWKIEDAGPVMISMPFEKGEIFLSTIEIDKQASASAQEWLSLIFTNSGVAVPFKETSKEDEIVIKKTVPIIIDGKLNEWLEDLEDRLVTPYIHAQPIYLTSENNIGEAQGFDTNLSGINYLLWNQEALHIAGVVFMEKLFFGHEKYPGNKNFKQEIRYNDDVILISAENNDITVVVNGKMIDNALVKTGNLKSDDMTDVARLQFDFIHASGKIETKETLTGETFELKIPWNLLKSKVSNEVSKALINLEANGLKNQMPLNADTSSKDNWLQMKIKN